MSQIEPVQSRLTRKILVTFLGGCVAFFIANLISEGLVFQVATGVFVGGVLLVTFYLIEVDHRLVKTEASQREGLLKINEATELFGLVEASALRTDVMTQLVRHSAQIDAHEMPLVFSFAQGEIARLSTLLRELGSGSDVVYEGEDRDWILGLTRNAVSTIDAVSLTTADIGIDAGLWASDLGQRYLRTQQEAVRRGVTIRRIFVADRPARLTKPDLLSVCETHTEVGIQVRVLSADSVPGTRATTMSDFIVFDGSISYEATPASLSTSRARKPVIINTRLVQQKSRVIARIHQFHELWGFAEDFK